MAAIALSTNTALLRFLSTFETHLFAGWQAKLPAPQGTGALTSASRLIVLVVLSAACVSAQQSRAVREQVAHVASALSAGHPQEAMDPFDKSFEGYARLRTYFTGLTDGYTIVNEMDISDEQIENREATLTIHWTMTLSDMVTGLSESRQEDLTVRLTMKKYDWRIIDISPLEFFDPEPKKSQ